MPAEVDRQVEAITENCLRKTKKKKKECERMAWAIVNSKKEKDKPKKKDGN